MLGENIPTDWSDEPSTFAARYAQNGALEGVFQLPYGGEVVLSRRSGTVSPEGNVYFLRTRKGSVDLPGAGFRPLKKGQIIDFPRNYPSQSQLSLADFLGRNGATAAVPVLNRARVIDKALQFANVHWRVNAGAYGPILIAVAPASFASAALDICTAGAIGRLSEFPSVGVVIDHCRGLLPP